MDYDKLTAAILVTRDWARETGRALREAERVASPLYTGPASVSDQEDAEWSATYLRRALKTWDHLHRTLREAPHILSYDDTIREIKLATVNSTTPVCPEPFAVTKHVSVADTLAAFEFLRPAPGVVTVKAPAGGSRGEVAVCPLDAPVSGVPADLILTEKHQSDALRVVVLWWKSRVNQNLDNVRADIEQGLPADDDLHQGAMSRLTKANALWGSLLHLVSATQIETSATELINRVRKAVELSTNHAKLGPYAVGSSHAAKTVVDLFKFVLVQQRLWVDGDDRIILDSAQWANLAPLIDYWQSRTSFKLEEVREDPDADPLTVSRLENAKLAWGRVHVLIYLGSAPNGQQTTGDVGVNELIKEITSGLRGSSNPKLGAYQVAPEEAADLALDLVRNILNRSARVTG